MSTITTLAEIVTDIAVEDPGRTALIFGEQQITYAQLNGMIEQVANGLAARGIGHGDRIALMLPNIPQFPAAYYAALRLGAVVVPLNLLYKADEVGYILNDSQTKAIFVFEMFYPQIAAGIDIAPSVEHVIFLGASEPPPGAISWANLVGNAPQREPATVAPSDLAVICYTSGTTGRPKGAMLTHRNFIANLEQSDTVAKFELTPADRILLVLPLFHIFGMNTGMNAAFRAGSTIALMPRFEPVPVLEAIQALRITFFLGAPPMYIAWINTPNLTDFDLSSLRIAGSGASALPREVLNRFQELTGVEILEGYGLTEASPVSHSNAAAPKAKAGTVGWPIPGVEARVVDEQDRDVPQGEEGEILLRGENIMVGYWGREEETAEAMRGGWFHTGDIATVDEEGYYTLVDRKKDMINAGGFKVWPREVEEVLFTHPAVQEAAVVAIPDAYAGERPMAYVALKAGKQATADELITYCKSRLASFKAPAQIEFRSELPKLPTGKILRRVLREEARTRTDATQA